jgi:hypothetical protein
MSLTVKSNGNGDFEITPEGVYVARCIKVIDLGTQTSTGQFGTKSQKQVMITWELLDEDVRMSDGRPFAATQFYTASLHEKAKLRKDLEAWRGKKFTDQELEGFDLNNVLGTYCQLQVVHSTDGQYANVNTIMAYKGEKPEGVNDLVAFDISQPDMKVFETFSDKMKAKITSAPEWGKQAEAEAEEEDVALDSDVVQEVNDLFPGATVEKPMPANFLKK